MDLSPQQIHYFKRELVTLQVRREIETLRQTADLSALRRMDQNSGSKTPFLRYLFQYVVADFPLLKMGNEDKFWQKCETFMEELQKSQQDACVPHQVDSQRKVLASRFENMAILALCANIRTVHGHEESIPMIPTKVEHETRSLEPTRQNTRIIRIATIRAVSRRSGTLRRKDHAEFVIQTSGTAAGESNVARRHGDFRRLRDQLKDAFPSITIPIVPPKAKRTQSSHDLCREKDRLALSAFLHRTAMISKLASSDLFFDFLHKDPITLTKEEKEDSKQRNALDKEREEEEIALKLEVDRKVVELEGLLGMLKKQVLQPGGLVKIFDIIKDTPELQDLPLALRKAFEWGRINFAFALHKQFVTSEYAPENLANLERTHGLMPYRMLAGVLKISNPMSMMKYVMDIFLARPFGSQSLLQRMIASSMNEEIKGLQRTIDTLRESINDDALCTKIYNAVYTKGVAASTSDNENATDEESIIALLQSENIEPQLDPDQITKLAFVQNNPQSQMLLKKLHKLWMLYAQIREQDTMMTLVFQGVTGDLLKDLFTIFYEPLAQLYKAAGIGRSLTHVAAFVDDLMALLASDPKELYRIQPFIDLVQRHEHRFYEFVHSVHSQDESHLFTALLTYMDRIFSFITRGIPEPYIDFDAMVDSAGLSLNERETLKSEIEALCDYRRRLKEQRLNKMRHKVGYTVDEQGDSLADFIPKSTDVMNALEDLRELDPISDEEDTKDDASNTSSSSQSIVSDSSDGAPSEIRPPKLVVLPIILPAFMHAVSQRVQ